MKAKLLLLFGFACLLAAPAARAGSIAFLDGPTGLQNGGPNPVTFPPTSYLEYQFVWVTDFGLETNISILPGLLVGYRWRSDHVYLSLGGAAAIDAHGEGIGFYMAAGYISGKDKGFHFNAEFVQVAAYDTPDRALLSPFSVRIGVDYDY